MLSSNKLGGHGQNGKNVTVMDSYKLLQQHSPTEIQEYHEYSQTCEKLTMIL
jgi:hypothetical protein